MRQMNDAARNNVGDWQREKQEYELGVYS